MRTGNSQAASLADIVKGATSMPASTKTGLHWKTPRARVPSQETAPMRRPQRKALASVIWFVTPCPGRVLAYSWLRTCAATLRTNSRNTLDRADFTRRQRTENGISQVQGQRDTQECVESCWLTGLKTAQGAQTDSGIFCQHGLGHIAGQPQACQASPDLSSYLLGRFHVFTKWPGLAS